MRINKNESSNSFFGIALFVLAVFWSLVSALIITGQTSVPSSHNIVVAILISNFLLSLVLVGLVTRELLRIWKDYKAGAVGADLHRKIVSLFVVIAIVPATLVAILAIYTLDVGIDKWLSQRFDSLISSSLELKKHYEIDLIESLKNDLEIISDKLISSAEDLGVESKHFSQSLKQLAEHHFLDAVVLYNKDGKEFLRVSREGNEIKKYISQSSRWLDLKVGQVNAVTDYANNSLLMIKNIGHSDLGYLIVVRFIHHSVAAIMQNMDKNIIDIKSFNDRQFGLKIGFALVYLIITLLLLLSVIWLGLGFANRLVSPLRELMFTTKRIAGGQYGERVKVEDASPDIVELSTTFNRMMSRVEHQHRRLVDVNDQIDQRRRFIETLLSGVSVGVLGVDSNTGKISLINKSAKRALGVSDIVVVDKKINSVVPELLPILRKALKDKYKIQRENITISKNGVERKLSVRVTIDLRESQIGTVVITIDDITELVTAQRMAAWADVARRIAHEIKNPLTPIQLSAERLNRRYGKKMLKDKEVFEQCTQTIIRQVDDIGRMVDEFSSFARMPRAEFVPSNLKKIIKRTVELMRVSSPRVSIDIEMPKYELNGCFDPRLITQALTNIIKNSQESIDSLKEKRSYPGKITVKASKKNNFFYLEITDNGVGLPADNKNRSRLLEPYVTTRKKGTGLGLSIVSKIIEEHAGTIELFDLLDYKGSGAKIQLIFPVNASKIAFDN